MDLGYGPGGDDKTTDSSAPSQSADGSGITDLNTGKPVSQANGEPADDINAPAKGTFDFSKGAQKKPGFDNGDPAKTDDDNKGDKPAESFDHGLEVGANIEVGDDKYSVDTTGNVVDKDGNIIKEAKDVKDWIASFDTIDNGDDTALSIDTIQKVVGIELTDDEGNDITFDNNPAGVKAYIESVLEVREDDIRQDTISTLYQKYPIVEDVLNYYIANGNSMEGFGQVQDYEAITIDDTNEAQQENIIRTAHKEFGRKGDVENYIAYLKSSGTLTAVSKEELKGLQESHIESKQALAEKAAATEEAQFKKMEAYWGKVKETIDSRSIAGYTIPDTIVINKDGKKISATPNDFYNHIYQIDANGKSAYQRSLDAKTPESRREDELLRAYLDFTGGTYSNLVDMAVNKAKVNTIRLQAKSKPTSSVKITTQKSPAAKGDIDFGFK